MEATRRENDDGEASPAPLVLPPEIITEIFLRLPIRSIGRFRCVSKAFCSMFTESGFAKRHLNLALRNDTFHQKLLVSLRNLYSFDLDSIGDGDGCDEIIDSDGTELDYPLKDEPSHFEKFLNMLIANHSSCSHYEELKSGVYKRNSVEIIGSSNGLVCIYPEEGGAFLYNPTTGESKRVPDSLRSKCEANLEGFEPFGFGYDAVNDDYKVVKFVFSEQGYHNADVYSLKTDSWRRISALPYKTAGCSCMPSVQVNGALHWVVELQNKSMVVAAFNLTTEEFRDIPLPDEISDYRFLEAANLKGHLCVVYLAKELRDFVWMMKDYGLERSWTKIKLNISYRSIAPLWSTKNDEEILLRVDGKLVLYNFECNTQRNLKFNSVKLRNFFEASAYVESLISPNSYSNGCTLKL